MLKYEFTNKLYVWKTAKLNYGEYLLKEETKVIFST